MAVDYGLRTTETNRPIIGEIMTLLDKHNIGQITWRVSANTPTTTYFYLTDEECNSNRKTFNEFYEKVSLFEHFEHVQKQILM